MSNPATTYTLKHPIAFGSETITKLEFRRPKGRDMRKITINAQGSVPLEDMMEMAGALTGHPQVVIDDMDAEDLFAVMEVVGNFLPRGRETGKKR